MLMTFFFFKQKTAYEMRISDWSSDVCSSDLAARRSCSHLRRAADDDQQRDREQRDDRHRRAVADLVLKIGRATCKGRGWRSGLSSAVDGSLKDKIRR